jgi:type I restriction/modification enzyme
MEVLISELKQNVVKLNGKYNLDDEFLDNLYSVYPFNRFEYIISHLIAEKILSLEQYLEIRNAYLRRNKFLYVFEITAPRTFGEAWAQRHLNELIPELDRPSKDFDKNYTGQYDFWYNGISIEVKASRAVMRKGGGTLLEKALSSNSRHGFDMNFQQIKPSCAKVFVWIGVWRDTIRYWVLSSDEVKNNKYFSKGQHRGNVGEGQLWIKDTNIKEFEKYLVPPREILGAIERKAK